MTNRETLNQMTNATLMRYLNYKGECPPGVTCRAPSVDPTDLATRCRKCWMKWLKAEAKTK